MVTMTIRIRGRILFNQGEPDAAYHHVTDIVMGFFVAGFTWVTSY